MHLREDLLRGVYAYGLEKPSAVQQRGIPSLISGRHCIIQAQSGTGKTATFGIAALQAVNLAEKDCQALVLLPTREIATQAERVIVALGDFMSVTCHAVVGGTNIRED